MISVKFLADYHLYIGIFREKYKVQRTLVRFRSNVEAINTYLLDAIKYEVCAKSLLAKIGRFHLLRFHQSIAIL